MQHIKTELSGNLTLNPIIRILNVLRYFHSGTLTKEQNKYSVFFDILGVENCADHGEGKHFKDYSMAKKLLPLFHIVQSDYIGYKGTKLSYGFFVQINSFMDNCKVLNITENEPKEIELSWKEETKFFYFIGWDKLNKK